MITLCLAILLSLPTAPAEQYNATFVKSITKLLDTLLDNYDRKVRPFHEEKPLLVTVHISVLSIGPISERDMEFTMDCYFRQNWIDERLKFEVATGNGSFLETLPLASKVLKAIWRPDTYIRNGRQSYLHTLTQPNILLRVRNDGLVFVSQRLTIRARCPMFFRKFPMDTQACPIYIGSLGFSSQDVVYEWKNVTVSEVQLAQYKLLRHTYMEGNGSEFTNSIDEPISVLQAYFILERQQGYYVLQIYTPCTLIVVMSWVSFWINKEASPARVGLGIMTVLTMSTLGLGGKNELPKISYSTAMDIYIVACFGFVFASLIEYAVVNFAYILNLRKTVAHVKDFSAGLALPFELTGEFQIGIKDMRTPKEENYTDLSSASEPAARIDEPLMGIRGQENSMCRNRRKGAAKVKKQGSIYHVLRTGSMKKKFHIKNPMKMVDRIDSTAKWIFPGLYLIFNFFYWAAFLYWIPDEIESVFDVKLD